MSEGAVVLLCIFVYLLGYKCGKDEDRERAERDAEEAVDERPVKTMEEKLLDIGVAPDRWFRD